MLPAPTTGGPACTTIYFDGTTDVDAVAADNINAAGEGFTLSAWVLRANAGYETAGEANAWERMIDFGNAIEAAEDDLAGLTRVYETMKPKDAAALFERMDARFAAGFLARMRPEAGAGIMAGLSPEAAHAISVVLAGRNARTE